MKKTAFVGVFILVVACAARAGTPGPRTPTKADKCPVCGMFVYKYPDFIAQVIFRDGSVLFFDGAKDMFKYLSSPGKYLHGKRSADIASMYVTEYYGLVPVNAVEAYYVAGSDVYGPMGRELLPFSERAQAQAFLHDHKGRAIYRYGEVTPAIIKGLD